MFKRKPKPEDAGLTPDFDSMIKILFWNSIGFFFFNFTIPFFVGKIIDSSGVNLGLSFSFLTIGGLFSSPFVGWLTDRTSKKRLILIGAMGRAMSYIILYISCILLSLNGFFAGMLILGFSVGFFWTPFDALVSEKSKPENRSYAFGKRRSAMGRGNLTGSLISFTFFGITNYFTPDNYALVFLPLVLFAAANVYGGIMFFKSVDESVKYEEFHQEHIHHLDSDPEMYLETKLDSKKNNSKLPSNSLTMSLIIGFVFLIITRFTAMFNGSLADPFLQQYVRLNIESNDIFIMLIYFPSGIVSQIVAPYIGVLSDKINNTVGIIISCITGALFTLLLINTTNPILFSLYLVIDSSFAIGGGLILMNLYSRISKAHRGKVFGLTSWIGRWGGITGPIVGGILWDLSTSQAPFILSIFVELALIPLFILAIWRLTPHLAEKVKKPIKSKTI